MSNVIAYEGLLSGLKIKVKKLTQDHKIIIPTNSWYFESITILESLIFAIKNKKYVGIKEKDDEYLLKNFTSLAFLKQLLTTLEAIDYLTDENLEVFLSKIKLVFQAPLLMINEDLNTSLGRNTLFELSLFSKFISKGLNARLHRDHHPDISVLVDKRLYVIECKRLYKPETLLKNTKLAIKQLKKYSLVSSRPEDGIIINGIVAISLNRYIHKGNKYFEAKSESSAEERIYFEMQRIFDENKDELVKMFPINIPVILFNYDDIGSIDKPYLFDFITVFDTTDGSTDRVTLLENDFKNLKS